MRDTVFGGNYSNHDNGATASIGTQVSPSLGTQFSYYQPSVKSNTTLLWYPSSPNVTVSTSSLSFGYHQIGSRSKAQKLTVTNGGNVACNHLQRRRRQWRLPTCEQMRSNSQAAQELLDALVL